MKTQQYPYWITTGGLGSSDNFKVSYSIHANGRNALIRAIQNFANQTNKPAWAEWDADFPNAKTRLYPRNPQR